MLRQLERGGRTVALKVRQEPTRVLGLVLAIVLTYLIVAPIVAVVSDGIFVQYRDAGRFDATPGSLTNEYLQRVFSSTASSAIFWRPLVRTLVVATGTTILAVVIGAAAAWLVARTDIPYQKFWSTAFVIPFIIPTWTFVLAWLTLFKNRRVAGPQGFAEAFGFTPPDWLAYGAVPIIVVSALSYFPLAFLLFVNAMQRMDSQLEESAQLLGARTWTIARRIVVPLLLPALTSSVLLVFARTVGSFAGPYVLGLPTNFQVLSTSLYSAFRTGDGGVMAVLAGVMVVLGAMVVAIDVYVLREYYKFITVTGGSTMQRTRRLRRWRWPATAILGVIGVASILGPIVVLLLSTVMRLPGLFDPGNFTLAYWTADQAPASPGFSGLLNSPQLLSAAFNSLRLAVGAALVCATIGMLVGYAVSRLAGSSISKYLRQTSFLPYLVPSIALSAAFLSLFAIQRGPIPSLYGTLTLLMLVMVIDSLPYASRAGISAMMQVGRGPEEAAMICGAGWRRRLTRIVLPIQKGAFSTAIVLPFISAMRELDIIVMIATPGTQVLTTLSFTLIGYGYTQLANGVALIIVVLVFIGALLAQRLTGANLSAGLKG